MKLFLTAALSCSMLFAVVGSPLRAAEPKVETDVATITEEVSETRIQLRHVKPSMMKAWLQYDLESPIPIPSAIFGGGSFEIPKGVERIEADDTTNSLRVLTDRDGFLRLREITAFLDKPIPQIDVQFQVFQMSRETARSLRGSFGDTKMPDAIAFTASKKTFPDLDKLVAQGKAALVSAPRVMTLTGMQGTILMSVFGLYYESRSESGKLLGYLPAQQKQEFVVTPTLMQNGVILLEGKVSLGYFPAANAGKSIIVKKLPKGTKAFRVLPSQEISFVIQGKSGDAAVVSQMQAYNQKRPVIGDVEYVITVMAGRVQRMLGSIAGDAPAQ